MRIYYKNILIILCGIISTIFPQSNYDSVLVCVKGIYFFGPSESELDSADENYLEAYSDFSYYTNKSVPFIKSLGMNPEYLSERIIKIENITESIIIDRDSLKFGTILFDEIKEPLILKYVLTDIELVGNIKQYFSKE